MPNVRLPDGTVAKLATIHTITLPEGTDIYRLRVKLSDGSLRTFNLDDCEIIEDDPDHK